jgi:hypothetical protein
MHRATLVVVVLLLFAAFYVALGHRSPPTSNGQSASGSGQTSLQADPHDPVLLDVLTPQNTDRIFRQVRDGRLPLEERLLFARAMARVAFSETAYVGETVGQVIAEQRAREKEKAGHAAKARGR